MCAEGQVGQGGKHDSKQERDGFLAGLGGASPRGVAVEDTLRSLKLLFVRE